MVNDGFETLVTDVTTAGKRMCRRLSCAISLSVPTLIRRRERLLWRAESIL